MLVHCDVLQKILQKNTKVGPDLTRKDLYLVKTIRQKQQQHYCSPPEDLNDVGY